MLVVEAMLHPPPTHLQHHKGHGKNHASPQPTGVKAGGEQQQHVVKVDKAACQVGKGRLS